MIEFVEMRVSVSGGTAIAIKNSGSLRRLMVLSFGAIVLSAEKNCASVWRAIVYQSSTGASPPVRLMIAAQHSRSITESEPSLRLSALMYDGPLSFKRAFYF